MSSHDVIVNIFASVITEVMQRLNGLVEKIKSRRKIYYQNSIYITDIYTSIFTGTPKIKLNENILEEMISKL